MDSSTLKINKSKIIITQMNAWSLRTAAKIYPEVLSMMTWKLPWRAI